jgi:hypothetical protein
MNACIHTHLQRLENQKKSVKFVDDDGAEANPTKGGRQGAVCIHYVCMYVCVMYDHVCGSMRMCIYIVHAVLPDSYTHTCTCV